MRKLISFFLALVMICSMSIAALATEPVLTMEDMAVQTGQTIYLTVTLNQSITADAMGIQYSYDNAILEALPASSIWELQGLLSDFNQENSGVWASAQPQNLKGRLFTLAFRLKDGATLTETTVTCKVVFKNGDNPSVEHTVTGRIYTLCNHSFGNWKTDGIGTHVRSCTLCGQSQMESHKWDSGITTDHPTNEHLDLVTYTCTICGETRSVEVTGNNTTTLPTVPTQPTEPTPTFPPMETIPPQTHETVPPTTLPTLIGPQGNSGNSGTNPTNPTQPTQPSHSTQPTQPTPGYNITDFNNSNQNNSGNQTGNNQTNAGTQSTNPTQPVTEDGNSGTNPTNPTEPVSGPYADSHNHSSNQSSIAVFAPNATEATDHDHDHTSETLSAQQQEELAQQQTQSYLSSGLALLAAFGCIGGAVVLSIILIRRTKRK